MSTHYSQVRRLAVDLLLQSGVAPFSERQLGQAVIQALVQSGFDLRHGPGLEEMKQLLADVLATAHREYVADASLQNV